MEPMLCTVLGVDVGNSGINAFRIHRFKRRYKDKHLTVEVEVHSEEHKDRLLSAKTIGQYNVKSSENVRKNCVTGTLKDFRFDFFDETDGDILKYLQEKGVKKVSKD